jgi:hypothetical protein
MSLWYESLSLELYDCGDNPVEKARCILAYLSMPVPRSWWEQALQTGDIRNWAALLCELQMELSKSLDLHEELSPDLLVALAFIDDDEPQKPSGRFDDTASKYTPDEYFARAKRVLAKHPELAQVGSLIRKAMGQMDPPSGSKG